MFIHAHKLLGSPKRREVYRGRIYRKFYKKKDLFHVKISQQKEGGYAYLYTECRTPYSYTPEASLTTNDCVASYICTNFNLLKISLLYDRLNPDAIPSYALHLRSTSTGR